MTLEAAFAIRLEIILRAAAEKQFVGKHLQAVVKDGLARDKSFVHSTLLARIQATFFTLRYRQGRQFTPWGRGGRRTKLLFSSGRG